MIGLFANSYIQEVYTTVNSAQRVLKTMVVTTARKSRDRNLGEEGRVTIIVV